MNVNEETVHRHRKSTKRTNFARNSRSNKLGKKIAYYLRKFLNCNIIKAVKWKKC